VIIGYARVSSVEQNLELQRDALKAAGCEIIFEDKASGSAKVVRPEWGKALEKLRAGDTLVVWRLDRLGRSLKHLIETIEDLGNEGIGFRSLQENLDTTTSGGKLIFHILGALAEFERELIRERTMAGLAAARARGRKGGRPRKLSTKQITMARQLLEDPDQQVTEVAKVLGVARSTLYMALRSETTVTEDK